MRIAIWGIGISGISALQYLTQIRDHEVYVINSGAIDSWYEKIDKFISKDHCFSQEQIPSGLELDLIVLSPGIDPRLEVLSPFKSVEKICEVELAYRELDLPIVAVTGSNGKTTTVTMIAQALTQAGKRVFLGGNIGTPFCEVLNDPHDYDIAVLELSSFQIELLNTFRANIAIILNISPTHMERYESFDQYQKAKLKIVMNQTRSDLFIAPKDYLGVSSSAQKIALTKLNSFDFSQCKLIGEHHKYNFRCVYEVLNHLNISQAKAIVQDLIINFSGVKFRLEYLGQKQGVHFYNDAKSTNLEATVKAVDSVNNEELVLIMGGKLRQDFLDLSSLRELKIKQIFAFGQARDLIFRQLSDIFEIIVVECLSDVFEKYKFNYGQRVVFSPGFPSFDQYENYIERGREFESLVNLSYSS